MTFTTDPVKWMRLATVTLLVIAIFVSILSSMVLGRNQRSIMAGMERIQKSVDDHALAAVSRSATADQSQQFSELQSQLEQLKKRMDAQEGYVQNITQMIEATNAPAVRKPSD
jgi:septal ring factor EnvC (AmiA/AmiB activator)